MPPMNGTLRVLSTSQPTPSASLRGGGPGRRGRNRDRGVRRRISVLFGQTDERRLHAGPAVRRAR